MGKLVKARPKGFGILNRGAGASQQEIKAELLNQATFKLQEYREANNSLAEENERLKFLLEGALKEIANLKGMPWPPEAEVEAAQ